jgi:transcription factor IIIB subunit 2
MSQNKTYCPNCGCTDIESHGASGASVCTACGVVVEENAIVSSVEFMEGAGGQSAMVGQFVGANGSTPFRQNQGRGGGGYGFSRDSRETTLFNGKKRIQDVASRLRLANHFVDTAHRHFTIAVEKNFVQGRRTTHVVAACLYIACRQEKSQHMLIDFSDALQVNVYTLGTCFVKFRRLLGLKLEVIDPALYISRFAAHLDLEDQANAVAITALRLVGRMKRDWIVSGRRPAGICAAALLIAARAHGFTKNHQDVTRILRVCGMTITQRIKDFESTPSANLTLEQFINIDLETEADPPRYTSNRIQEARALAIQAGNVELLTSGKLDDPREKKRATKWRQNNPVSKQQKDMDQLYTQLATEMTENNNGEAQDAVQQTKDAESSSSAVVVSQQSQTQEALVPQETANEMALSNIPFPKGNNGKQLVLANQATIEELQKSTQPEEDKLNLDEWKQDMPSEYMDEIEDLFRDDEEVKQKEAIFNKMNKEYIEKQKEKENDRIAAETLQKELEDDDAAQAEEHSRYFKKTKRRSGKSVAFKDGTPSTQDALLAAISTRKISRKINYDAMSAIFDDSGNFSTELLEDNEPVKSNAEVM